MEDFILKETSYSPKIEFSAQKGELNISGKSYPENTFELYSPVFEWLKEYFETTTNETTTVNIELIYLNSTSLKVLFDIFDMFEIHCEEGKDIQVNWIYDPEDDIIEEIGEDMKEDFQYLKVNLKQI